MNIHDYRFLLSEQSELNNLIALLPESEILNRVSLNDRLRRVEAELGAYDGYSPELVNASLTFEGNPVFGSRGIHADFGLDAVKGFVRSVGLVGASFHGALGPTGPVSNMENYGLMITGTAVGSFGFQVEPVSQQPVFEGQSSPVEVAISRFKGVLEASIGTDEDLMDAIEGIDKRALKEVSDFLKIVADSAAVCALAVGREVFRFHDVEQVRRSQNRLSQDVREDDVTVSGKFLGFFPHNPRAQFEIERVDSEFGRFESGRVVTMKVESSVADATDINSTLNQAVRIQARARRVGSGRPRYVLMRIFV